MLLLVAVALEGNPLKDITASGESFRDERRRRLQTITVTDAQQRPGFPTLKDQAFSYNFSFLDFQHFRLPLSNVRSVSMPGSLNGWPLGAASLRRRENRSSDLCRYLALTPFCSPELRLRSKSVLKIFGNVPPILDQPAEPLEGRGFHGGFVEGHQSIPRRGLKTLANFSAVSRTH